MLVLQGLDFSVYNNLAREAADDLPLFSALNHHSHVIGLVPEQMLSS